MPLRALLAAPLLAVVCGQALAADVVGYSEAFDTLFRVDLTTHTAQEIGAAGFVGTQRIADIEGISYSPAGDLFAVSDALKALIRVNAQTGRATVVVRTGRAGDAVGAGLSQLARSADISAIATIRGVNIGIAFFPGDNRGIALLSALYYFILRSAVY